MTPSFENTTKNENGTNYNQFAFGLADAYGLITEGGNAKEDRQRIFSENDPFELVIPQKVIQPEEQDIPAIVKIDINKLIVLGAICGSIILLTLIISCISVRKHNKKVNEAMNLMLLSNTANPDYLDVEKK